MDPEEEKPFTVIFNDCSKGLGLKIIGGLGEEEGDQDYGIFIMKILPDGLAAERGVLQEGDLLLSVNGESLENVTNAGAVQLLRDASATNYVKLVVIRDSAAREEYESLLNYSYSSTNSVCDRTSLTSPVSQNNGWTSPVSHTSCGSYSHMEPLRQRCEGSSSGSEQGSLVGATNATSQPLSPHVLSSTSVPTDKVPCDSVSSGQNQLFSLKPGMTSSPYENHPDTYSKTGCPDGASSGTPDCVGMETTPMPSTMNAAQNKSRIFPPQSSSSSNPGTFKGAPSGYNRLPDAEVRVNSAPSKPTNLSRKISLDPYVRLKVSKLEMGLKYLGIELKPEEYTALRNRLHVDSNGMVIYKDFVEAVKDVVRLQLDEKKFSSPPAIVTVNDIKDFIDPPAFTPEKDDSYYDNLRRENEDLRKEVKTLMKLLREKEDELIRVRQEAHLVVCKTRSLHNKVHLAEQAQKAAQSKEQDYEEVILLLEAENRQLRQQIAQQANNPVVQKKMAVLGCQLRKLEVTKKTYEVATEKLLHFAEVVHDTLSNPGPPSPPSRPESAASRTSTLPSGHQAKQPSLAQLAAQAKDVAKAVRTLLEVEPLPFGWEESYTADGMKYYINHVTQVTTWQHPLSNVQHATSAASLTNNNNNHMNNRNQFSKITGRNRPLEARVPKK